jgi:hypothetical protein
MPAFHTGTITEVLHDRAGFQRVLVDFGAARPGRQQPERAYVLTDLVGTVAVGDRVVVNTTAVDLDLGTGGWHVVHWNLERDGFQQPGPGHIMKLRYTSLQADTGSAEEHVDDVHHDLAGLPVAVCGLHSQMAVVATVARALAPELRIAYVMTDGAALPLAFSDLVATMRARGVLDHTLTAGGAFGGEVEAVTVPSALLWARHHLDADVAVVAMGPGITGTDSRLGTTGIEVASILDQVVALDGEALMVLRMSSGDTRARHQGLSHHSATVLDLVRSAVRIPVPEPVAVPARHTPVEVDVPDVAAMLDDAGIHVTTMGRGPAEDPAFFRAAGAAGVMLAELGTGSAPAP